MPDSLLERFFRRKPELYNKQHIETLTKHYAKLDINGDNHISRAEFFGSTNFFNDLDQNKDGEIDFDEFLHENGTKKLTICVVLVNRANYARLKPVMQALKVHKNINLQIICAGSMLLDRFGNAVNFVEEDGFDINRKIYMEIEGCKLESMTKSIGVGVMEFASTFSDLDPDFVLLIGDRYETLAAAIAAACQNYCIIHLQGGEITGSIDESIRHVITKLSHFHFPATAKAGRRIERMGEQSDTIFPLGCPIADVTADSQIPASFLNYAGVGTYLDYTKPFLLVVFHPVTTELDNIDLQMLEILKAIEELAIQTIFLWPNIDAGSDKISQAIRQMREMDGDFALHVYKHLDTKVYMSLLARTVCAVGNSSSFIRDASFFGTPVVLVGSRQDGRERTEAVKRVTPDQDSIMEAIYAQIKHGTYEISDLYGKVGVSKEIVDTILTLEPYSQKRLFYASS